MSKEIVVGTCHRFNWVQLGAGVQHPDTGKILECSESLSQEAGIPDASLKIMPYNGYGDPGVLRYLMMMERPAAILHFTDPRYWVWLYHMEAEVREYCPILYLNIWDDVPAPQYNRDFYRSSDALFAISKQTFYINKTVLGEKNVEIIDFGDHV